jgi:hypothetical protein
VLVSADMVTSSKFKASAVHIHITRDIPIAAYSSFTGPFNLRIWGRREQEVIVEATALLLVASCQVPHAGSTESDLVFFM